MIAETIEDRQCAESDATRRRNMMIDGIEEMIGMILMVLMIAERPEVIRE